LAGLGVVPFGTSGLSVAEISRRAENVIVVATAGDPIGPAFMGAEEAVAWRRGIAALSDPSCPARLLRDAYRVENGGLRKAALENPSCPVLLLVRWWAKSGSKSLLARHRRTPRLLLAWWARSGGRRQRQAVVLEVAQNQRTPPVVLSRLAEGEEMGVGEAVAENPKTPRRTVDKLARSPHPLVAAAAAANPRCSPSELGWLAERAVTPEVLGAVAANPNTRPGALARLAAHSDTRVRAAAAANPNTPPAARALSGLLVD